MTNKKNEKNKENRKINVLRDEGHAFDGIQEYDNDMPRWWVNLFIISIIFSICYLAWYHTPWFPSKSIEQEYAEEKAQIDAKRAELQAAAAESSTSFDLAAAAQDAALVALGKEVYDGNCAACHAEKAQGLVGPNLTDDFWIYGSTYADLTKVVDEGLAEKGMPAWGPILGPEKVKASIVYIKTLQGTNPEGAKPAEGEQGILQ